MYLELFCQTYKRIPKINNNLSIARSVFKFKQGYKIFNGITTHKTPHAHNNCNPIFVLCCEDITLQSDFVYMLHDKNCITQILKFCSNSQYFSKSKTRVPKRLLEQDKHKHN